MNRGQTACFVTACSAPEGAGSCRQSRGMATNVIRLMSTRDPQKAKLPANRRWDVDRIAVPSIRTLGFWSRRLSMSGFAQSLALERHCLCDLKADPQERLNIASAHPHQTEQMLRRLSELSKEFVPAYQLQDNGKFCDAVTARGGFVGQYRCDSVCKGV